MEKFATPFFYLNKKETKHSDWVEPFTTFVSRIYGNSVDVEDQIKAFNTLRENAADVDDTVAGKDILYSYYGQLDYLSFRFPTGGNGINISFEWSDILDPDADFVKQSSLAFEKASVLFNLVSLLSRMAANHASAYTVDDYKAAANCLQCASGIAKLLRESFIHAPGRDLDSNFLLGIYNLFLGQAQECVLGHMSFSASDSNMNYSLAAKIASSAATLYDSCVHAFESMEPACNPNFIRLASAKKAALEGFSSYFMARAHLEKSKQGLAIGYLQQAKSILSSAQKLFNGIKLSTDFIHKPSLSDYPQTISTFIKSSLSHLLKTAEKDNDFVFHDLVVKEVELPKISPLQALPPLPLEKLYGSQGGFETAKKIVGDDLFKAFVPSAVTTASSLYSEETAKVFRAEQAEVERQNTQMATVFASLDLSRLQEITHSDSKTNFIPKELIEARSQLISFNPTFKIHELFAKSTKLKQIIAKIKSDLEVEANENAKMKAKLGPSWTLSDSLEFAAPYQSELNNYLKTLAEASATDSAISQQYALVKDDVETLCNSSKISALLESSISSTDNSGQSLLDIPIEQEEQERDMKIQLDLLEELQSRVQKLVPERQTTLQALQQKCLQDDISESLMQNSKRKDSALDTNQLFELELKKFDPLRNRLHASYRQQQLLLNEMRNVTQKLKQNPEFLRKMEVYNNQFSKNKELCSNLLSSSLTAKAISEGVSKGLEYYKTVEQRLAEINKTLGEQLLLRRKQGATCLSKLSSSSSSHTSISSNMRNLHI